MQKSSDLVGILNKLEDDYGKVEDNKLDMLILSEDNQILARMLVALQYGKKKVDEFIRIQTKSIQELEQFLNKWEMKYDFDAIVNEVNIKLSDAKAANDISQLQEELNKIKESVDELKDAVTDLEKNYNKLLLLPNRHGKEDVVKKVKDFLDILGLLHISEINNAVGVTIPKLNSNMQKVFDDLKTENKKRDGNKEYAYKLIDRINTFRTYANKFNNNAICDSCESAINAMLNNPSIVPDEDKKKLEFEENKLDCLQKEFDKEKVEFSNLKDKVCNEKIMIWKDDYNFINKFNKDSCVVNYTIEQLKIDYDNLKSKKKNDIAEVKSRYGQGIINRFSDDFYSISNHFVDKSDLTELVGKIDEFKRERTKKILKIIGWIVIIPIMIVIFIISTLLSSHSDDD